MVNLKRQYELDKCKCSDIEFIIELNSTFLKVEK